MPQSSTVPSVAVLVLNRDGAHFLHDCFRSLLANTYPPFDIYLIDNHSQDSSVDLTRTHYPQVKIVENKQNYGFAGAYDRQIRQLHHKYVVLLNNDTIVDTKWLEALFKVAESDERIAACGSKILMMWDRTLIDHAGGMLTAIGSGLDRGKWTRDRGDFDKTTEIGFGCGCSLLIDRQAYLDVGGFDPEYVIYHEDVDLCWKLRLFGYSVMYVPDSIVYHHLGGGVIQSVEHPRKTYLCQKNRLANMVKNTGFPGLIASVLASTAYDLVRSARFASMRRWDLLRVLLKGYADTFRNGRHLLRSRGIVQRRRVRSDADMKEFFSPLLHAAQVYRQIASMHGPIEKQETDTRH